MAPNEAQERPEGKWTNAFLDEMRQIGDPLADDVVGKLFASGGVFAVNELMATLAHNDNPTPEQLPEVLRGYLAETSAIPTPGQAAVQKGQDLFDRYGPEMLVVLGCYSLPVTYAAAKGVKVLYRTAYIAKRPNRRLVETGQMIVDALTPGGLDPGGRGVRSAQKVRLMHAAVRWLLRNDPERPWDSELGFPINQEDLSGTLMMFGPVILDGLQRLGLSVSEDEQEAYLQTWQVIGKVMGVRDELNPATVADARLLGEIIMKRQMAPSDEGRAMTRALLDMMEGQLPPGPLRHWPSALIRFFLPAEACEGFGIAQYPFEQRLLEATAHMRSHLEAITGERERKFWLVRKFSLAMIECYLTVARGGERAGFGIPTHVRQKWEYTGA